MIIGGNSKITVNVEFGRGILKKQAKMNRGRGFKLVFTFGL